MKEITRDFTSGSGICGDVIAYILDDAKSVKGPCVINYIAYEKDFYNLDEALEILKNSGLKILEVSKFNKEKILIKIIIE